MAKGFFKDMKSELKKVVWPTTGQIINNTLLVIGLVIVVSLVVLGIDLVLEYGDMKLWNLISKYIG
ncbi:MAG: preprotein translocase subunit SecE [Clostridia bacterium]|nr:preprotein translocase subunit SecE [Clostridia bacterium]MDD4375521.1 preprotein translocase subunit SecE [Clostridia bacterium]